MYMGWCPLTLTASHSRSSPLWDLLCSSFSKMWFMSSCSVGEKRQAPIPAAGFQKMTQTTWFTVINSLLPYNSLRVVPDFPRRAREPITASRVGANTTVQEAGIKSESASFVVSFPFVGVSVRQPPPKHSDPTALLLPPSADTAPASGTVVVVAIGFQWYKVPLFRYFSVPHWGRHPLSPDFAVNGVWVKCPVPAGEDGSRRPVDARFQARCALRTSGVAVIDIQIPEPLCRLPNLHPQVVSGSTLFWLKPGDSRIHQTTL